MSEPTKTLEQAIIDFLVGSPEGFHRINHIIDEYRKNGDINLALRRINGKKIEINGIDWAHNRRMSVEAKLSTSYIRAMNENRTAKRIPRYKKWVMPREWSIFILSGILVILIAIWEKGCFESTEKEISVHAIPGMDTPEIRTPARSIPTP